MRQIQFDQDHPMLRIHHLLHIDHIAYLTSHTLERWAALSALTPLEMGILVAYIYSICGRSTSA